jgi:RNA polymerase sigma-54 factor
MTQLSDRARALVGFLIEALDDDGYLTQALDELVDLLVADDDEAREALEELAIALRHLQNLDPPGIGARNARECLSLQLIACRPPRTRALALRIVGASRTPGGARLRPHQEGAGLRRRRLRRRKA